MLTISKVAELKLSIHGVADDSAGAACIGRHLENPQLVVVFRRELATKLTGSLPARKKIGD
jgi:hypothetical protein